MFYVSSNERDFLCKDLYMSDCLKENLLVFKTRQEAELLFPYLRKYNKDEEYTIVSEEDTVTAFQFVSNRSFITPMCPDEILILKGRDLTGYWNAAVFLSKEEAINAQIKAIYNEAKDRLDKAQKYYEEALELKKNRD